MLKMRPKFYLNLLYHCPYSRFEIANNICLLYTGVDEGDVVSGDETVNTKAPSEDDDWVLLPKTSAEKPMEVGDKDGEKEEEEEEHQDKKRKIEEDNTQEASDIKDEVMENTKVSHTLHFIFF